MKNGQKLLGYYNYTVVLTYIGMLIGFAGVFCAADNQIFSALVCLMAAGVCDMFDGAIASTRERTEQEKCFGIQIDSLSDLVCFGVLPAMIVSAMNPRNIPVRMIAALYVLCALIRLAYFNVDEQEQQKASASSRELYFGLPVTLAALFLPLVYSFGNYYPGRRSALMAGTLVLMAALFLLPFPLKKPKRTGKLFVLLCGIIEAALVVFSRVNIQ